MNINQTLLNTIRPRLIGYGCNVNSIQDFMRPHTDFLARQDKAIRIIKTIMTSHGKKKLLPQVVELAKVEHGIRELELWVRDHVVHAMLTFILGIYINDEFMRYTFDHPVDHFQWKLAGLFHDIGYPAQVAKDILEQFTRTINTIKDEIGVSAPDVSFRFVPVGIQNLRCDQNSFSLIQERIDEWSLSIDIVKEYNQMINTGNICHGMISALAVLYIIDLMYQKHNPKRDHTDIYSAKPYLNWNQIYFERDVVSACTAIFIHNLSDRCFQKSKIDRSKAPLAFLLKLSDILQEWERPSADNPKGLDGSKFDIRVVNDEVLVFHAIVSNKQKDKIKKDISSFLVVPDVQIH